MANFLDDYEPVSDRIDRFWKEHKAGRIITDLVHFDEKRFIVKALIWRSDFEDATRQQPDATGYAEEVIGSSNVNRTSALENCETSAIGRALANLGYAVKNRASREEMEKVQTRERPRQGGMKRIPGPRTEVGVTVTEPSQSHGNGTQAHLTAEQAIRVATMKKVVLNRCKGDQIQAREMWRQVLGTFSLEPSDPIPADMIESLESVVAAG